MITVNSPEFIKWLDAVKVKCETYHKEHYGSVDPLSFRAEEGTKFIRIWQGHSCYGFVAKCNNQTKALGTVLEGDVMMAATWKAPAKHSRGNLYDEHGGLSMIGPFGVQYLDQKKK